MSMAGWRAEIDAIDQELLRLLNARAPRPQGGCVEAKCRTLALRPGARARSAGTNLPRQ